MKKKINLMSLRQNEIKKDEMQHLLGGDDPELASDQCRYVCSCSAACGPDVPIGPPESDHNLFRAKESTRTGGLLKILGFYTTGGSNVK